MLKDARVAELVYAHDLKSCLARDVGSIPTPGTFDCELKIKHKQSLINIISAHNSAGRVAPS